MNNIKERIEELAISLKRDNDAYYAIDVQKIKFGLYLSFLKKGYFQEDDLANDDLLSNTPTQYLPCDVSIVDTFHLSTPTVRSIVLEYSQFASLSLSEQDAEVIRDLSKSLPLTIEQINFALLAKGVFPNSISTSAFCEIATQVCGGNFSSFRLYPVSARRTQSGELGVRLGRFERSAVMIVTTESSEKKLKSVFPKLIRACEKMAALTYAVDLQCAVDLKVNKLNKKTLISIDTIMAVLSARDDFYQVSSDCCILSSAHSARANDFVHTLVPYIKAFGSMSIERLPVMFRRFFDYRVRVGSYRTAKSGGSDRVSSLDFSRGYTDGFFSMPTVLACLRHSGYFEISDTLVTLSDTAPDVKLFSYWHEMLLSFVVERQNDVYDFYSCLETNQNYERHLGYTFAEYCAEKYKLEMLSALKEPRGFFIKQGSGYSVDDATVMFADNHRGDYIEPTATVCDELILLTMNKLDEHKQISTSNFTLYKDAIDKEWKTKGTKRATLPNLYSNAEYVADLEIWFTYSHFQQSLTYLRSDTVVCEKAIELLKGRRAYIESLERLSDGSLSERVLSSIEPTIERLDSRIALYENRIEVNRRLSDAVLQSDRYKSYLELMSELEELKERKQSLKISAREYKAHLFIHDYLRKAGDVVTETDMLTVIDEHIKSLLITTTSDGATWYNNGHVLVTTHPYSVPPRL
ncbi:hypothetical protein [Vibrio fluvialis]|uniref:hypothetical protein n=1 Tax=Vibrio fluvialis TaxID=676 RepID=UPI0023A98BA8|nr:hypothetical protein [Vibrio fluvialis]MDE5179223.1 hypothetical protein [Vibrio fluvialis]